VPRVTEKKPTQLKQKAVLHGGWFSRPVGMNAPNQSSIKIRAPTSAITRYSVEKSARMATIAFRIWPSETPQPMRRAIRWLGFGSHDDATDKAVQTSQASTEKSSCPHKIKYPCTKLKLLVCTMSTVRPNEWLARDCIFSSRRRAGGLREISRKTKEVDRDYDLGQAASNARRLRQWEPRLRNARRLRGPRLDGFARTCA
jgi:hypothetical protein